MNDLSASRLTALVTVIVAALMIGSPAWVLGGKDLGPVGEASAADGSRIFRLGVVDMTISTLNPNTYTMVAEGMAIFPMFSTLMQWDSAGENIIGDLAKSWTYSPDGLTYECELVDTAYWVVWDADNDVLVKGPQVTSADVKWSVDTLAANDASRLNTYWPDFDGVNIIQETWCDDAFHFGITINRPFVPFTESLMGNLIFPKYIWENEDFINFDNYPFVSSGAFFYKTEGDPDAGYVQLGRNPYWHGETSYGWQLHVDEFVMVRYDDVTTLYEALKLGNDVDAMMGVDYAAFVEDMPDYPQLAGYSQSNGFVYEFNLNQMTDAYRLNVTGPLKNGDNSQLLLNHSVKKAISMCVDRQYLIDEYLYGYGTYTTTLVPNQNPMSHTYATDGHDCLLDPGATEAVIDPIDRAAARQLLMDAGWAYDVDGHDALPDTVPLCRAGGADPLSFRFYTLDTSNIWEGMCNDIVAWTAQAGVELTLELKSVNELNTAWYAADYDVWLWDWVLYPYGEAVSSVLSLFTTDVIGTDSDVYISSEEYDAMYYEALQEMDYYKRQELCYDMQDWVYLNRGCQALAFREDLYAFNIDNWENFGDLENEYFLLPDVWPVWISTLMNAVGNHAPVIGGVTVNPNADNDEGVAEIGTAVTFTPYDVVDDHQAPEALEYTWIWGFGGEQETTSYIPVDHTFTEDGVYSVTLVVKETAPADGHADYLSSYYTTYVTVYDYSNDPPGSLAIAKDIASPTAGEVVTFTGTAVDPEGDELYYSWDFGDGSDIATGDVVEHQFPADGGYTVTLMVDDNHYGAPGTRPATCPELVAVGPNHAPSISVPDFGEVTVKVSQTFTAMASDADPRDELRYTWDWGDDTLSVTTVPYAEHTYNWKGSYVVTVYADDLTGLDGHNVSDTGTVSVVVSGNNIPAIVLFEVSSTTGYLGQTLTFDAIAGDGDGDPLTFTFDWDDGTTNVQSFPGEGPNEPVECTADKAYSEAGTYSVYLTVTDGIAVALSPEIVVTVEENAAPVITAFAPEAYWDTGLSMDFVVSAEDDDGDTLEFTWDWGDGGTDETAIPVASHTFAVSGTYTVGVTVDDGKGFTDYAEADVVVNSVPYIDPPLGVRSVDEDASYDYSVSAHDDDGDSLTCMWDFGDGTTAFGQTVSHTYADVGTYTYSVWVWDDFVEHRTTHNATSSSTVNVGLAGVDDPPVIEPLDAISAVEGESVEIWAYASDDGGDEYLTYIWDFDDLSDLLVADPPVTHSWAAPGDYTLTVWVHDDSGLPANNVSATASVHIVGDEPPVADAGGDRVVEEEVSVAFTAEASSDDLGIVGYDWTVNDHDGAHTFTTETFSYTFEMPGVYTVDLVVEDTIGQFSTMDTISVTVTDETAPTADAGEDQVVHCGTTVTFSGSGVDGDGYDTSLDFTWTFIYDGALETLSGQSPSFLFEIIGGYVVTLRVEDDSGNYAEDEMTVNVLDLVDPVADAGADQTVDAGDTVTFDGAGSYDDDTAITYEWTFTYDGAAEVLTGVAPTFVFDIAGSYVVTLTVEDEGGNTATDTVTITVNAVANVAPVADAGADQTVDAGDTVTFTGAGSSDSDGTIASYVWTFTYDGAAQELTGVSPTFVFAIAGSYTVTLTVTDDDGATDTDTVAITVSAVVNDPPVADAGDDASITVGTVHTFDGSGSSADVSNYTWTFVYNGATVTLYGVGPSHTFGIVGVYTVTLTVADAEGLTATDTVVVTVTEVPSGENEPPVADAGDDIEAVAGDTVDFDGSGSTDSDGTIVEWVWTFEYDGETQTLEGETAEFQFDEPGTYTVTLTVTDSDGDTDTDTVTVTVEPGGHRRGGRGAAPDEARWRQDPVVERGR